MQPFGLCSRRMTRHSRPPIARAAARGVTGALACTVVGTLVFGSGSPWLLLLVPLILIPPGGHAPSVLPGWLFLAASCWGGGVTVAGALSGYTGMPLALALAALAPFALFLTAPWILLARVGPISPFTDALRIWLLLVLWAIPPLAIFAVSTPLNVVLGMPPVLLASLPSGWPRLAAAITAVSTATLPLRLLIHSGYPRPASLIGLPRIPYAYTLTLMLSVALACALAFGSHPPAPGTGTTYSITRPAPHVLIVALHTRQPLALTRTFARTAALGTLLQADQLAHALNQISQHHPGLFSANTLVLTPEFAAGNLCRYPSAALPLGPVLAAHPATLFIIGAEIPVQPSRGAQSGCTDGAALFRGPRLLQLIPTSQPAPVSEWNPFRHDPDYPAHWFRTAHISLPHRRSLAVLVCYAGTVPWFPLLAASSDHAPVALLSIDSDLWHYGRRAGILEYRILRAWGRFYGLPVAIADALPPDKE